MAPQHQGKRGQQKEWGRERMGNERSRKKFNQCCETRMRGAIAEYRELVEAGSFPQLCFLARVWMFQNQPFSKESKAQGTIRRKPFISQKNENILAELVKTLGKRGFPLRMEDIRNLMFQFAQKGDKGLLWNQEKKLATPGFRGSWSGTLTSVSESLRVFLLAE